MRHSVHIPIEIEYILSSENTLNLVTMDICWSSCELKCCLSQIRAYEDKLYLDDKMNEYEIEYHVCILHKLCLT